jgi:uncharacterized protein (UPF0548 family)
MLPAAERDRLAATALTYAETGATAGPLPGGYHQLARRVVLGRGEELLASAGDAVARWQVQLRAGVSVAASAPVAAPGTVVLLGIGAGRLRLAAPCRVVYVIDEPRRRGFAYGTLPGHPESGEEAFVVEQDEDGTVTFAITAFSRPASRLASAAGPAGRLAQGLITTRYLRSLAR